MNAQSPLFILFVAVYALLTVAAIFIVHVPKALTQIARGYMFLVRVLVPFHVRHQYLSGKY